jgi:Ca2+-binding RTX toxin-like protein
VRPGITVENTLIGNSGNNTLDGGGGADTMSGGSGNDNYYVDHSGDRVIEVAEQGIDTIVRSRAISEATPLAVLMHGKVDEGWRV